MNAASEIISAENVHLKANDIQNFPHKHPCTDLKASQKVY